MRTDKLQVELPCDAAGLTRIADSLQRKLAIIFVEQRVDAAPAALGKHQVAFDDGDEPVVRLLLRPRQLQLGGDDLRERRRGRAATGRVRSSEAIKQFRAERKVKTAREMSLRRWRHSRHLACGNFTQTLHVRLDGADHDALQEHTQPNPRSNIVRLKGLVDEGAPHVGPRVGLHGQGLSGAGGAEQAAAWPR